MKGGIEKRKDESKLRESKRACKPRGISKSNAGSMGARKRPYSKSSRIKKTIETTRNVADKAEREGNYEKVAELRYENYIAQLEKDLKSTQCAIDEMQEKKSLLKEEVDTEDIAEIVARWTGIPVTRMMQSERQKNFYY